MTVSDAARDAVAQALDVHQFEYIGPEEGYDCGCNERGDLGPWHFLSETQQHQAQAVLEAAAPYLRADDPLRARIEELAESLRDQDPLLSEILRDALDDTADTTEEKP